MNRVDYRLRFGFLPLSFAVLVLLTLLGPSPVRAQVFTRDTIRPLLIADVNALAANRYFVQSMLAFNSTPITVGYGTQQATAKFLRIDDEVVRGGLGKDQVLMNLGFGRPATGLAAYGVLNFVGTTVGDFPRGPWTGNYSKINLRATNAAVFAAVGLAFRGWVAQYGYSYSQLRIHSDQYGRLTYCGDAGWCSELGYPTRLGAPSPVIVESHKTTASNKMLTLESSDGYSIGALLAALRDVSTGGDESLTQSATESASNYLASLRLMAQPEEIERRFGTAYGLGVNTYAKEIDY